MHSYLQKQIKDRMEEKNLSIYALEKKARLKRSAVRNILQGLSKKPSAEVLQAIATVLECGLEDLMTPRESNKGVLNNIVKPVVTNKNTYEWDEKLYINAVKAISKLVEEKAESLKLEQMISLINEIYKYTLDKKSDHIDHDFGKWLINKAV